jgi:hypothetical protein
MDRDQGLSGRVIDDLAVGDGATPSGWFLNAPSPPVFEGAAPPHQAIRVPEARDGFRAARVS